MRYLSLFLVGSVACGAATPRSSPRTTGEVAGRVVDAASGEPISRAQIIVESPDGPRYAKTDAEGAFTVPDVPAGETQVEVTFATASARAEDVAVLPGRAAVVDVELAFGTPGAEAVIDLDTDRITRFSPPGSSGLARIEGAVRDREYRGHLAGAVITIGPPGSLDVVQVVSDDAGRFRVDGLAPGRYAVSAYYARPGVGQVTVQRIVEVAAAEGVRVPIWLEAGL